MGTRSVWGDGSGLRINALFFPVFQIENSAEEFALYIVHTSGGEEDVFVSCSGRISMQAFHDPWSSLGLRFSEQVDKVRIKTLVGAEQILTLKSIVVFAYFVINKMGIQQVLFSCILCKPGEVSGFVYEREAIFFLLLVNMSCS